MDFNNPFDVGQNVLMNNMASDSQTAKMNARWTGPYTIVEVSVMRVYKLKDKHGHILKTHSPMKTRERVLSWDAHRRI